MYDFISGTIAELNPSCVIIENFGIGYSIYISLHTYTKLNNLKEARLYVQQIIREDSNNLYGFFEKQEREVFRLLILVSGVGPNTARLMLSYLTYNNIQKAILEDDVATLKSIKGIGLKTAQRIIVDLKDKITNQEDEQIPNIFDNKNITDEATSALLMLGFTRKAVEKVIETVIKKDKHLSVEDLVKQSLKML